MSMDRFAPALHRIARELDLPPAERGAILLEMAADLEAIYERERRRGASDEAAAERAERMVLGSPEMLRRLSEVHRRSWRGWSERTGARLLRGLDRWLLLIGVLPVILVASHVAAPAVLSPRTPSAWLLVGLALLLVATVAAEAWRVGLRGAAPRAASIVLVLSALAPALGLLALVSGVYGTAMHRLPLSHMGDQLLLAQTVAQHGPAVVLGLLIGVTGVLCWFLLQHLSATRRTREVDALLRDRPSTETGVGAGRVLPLVRGRSA